MKRRSFLHKVLKVAAILPFGGLSLDLLQQQVCRHKAERLIGFLAQVDALFPPIVLADYDTTDTMLHAQVHNKLIDMMEVVFQSPVPLAETVFAGMFIEPLVYAFDDATIDQYRTVLVVSYRSQTV